jgi:hypothetical protein
MRGFFECDGHAVPQVASALWAIAPPASATATSEKLIKDAAASATA